MLLGAWLAFEDKIITNLVITDLPASYQSLSEPELNLIINDLRNHLSGNVVSRELSPDMQVAAAHYGNLRATSEAALTVLFLSVAMLGMGLAWRKIAPDFWARNRVEAIVKVLLIICSTLAIFITIGIVLSVLFESIRFFQTVSIFDFLFGLEWSPQTAIREDQVGSSGAFGAVPLFAGTLLISVIAMLVAAPIGLTSAIYLSEYSHPRFRATAKPLLEILAGIATISGLRCPPRARSPPGW